MITSDVNSRQSLYDTNSTYKSTKLPSSSQNMIPGRSDTVNFSLEAKELFQKAQVDNNVKKATLPYEAFALPKWLIEFFPKESIVNHPDIELQERYTYSGEKHRAIGNCANTSLKYLNEEYEKAGLSTVEIYYMKTSHPEQYEKYSGELYRSVRMRLLEDEQYVKDMEYLGNTV